MVKSKPLQTRRESIKETVAKIKKIRQKSEIINGGIDKDHTHKKGENIKHKRRQ